MKLWLLYIKHWSRYKGIPFPTIPVPPLAQEKNISHKCEHCSPHSILHSSWWRIMNVSEFIFVLNQYLSAIPKTDVSVIIWMCQIIPQHSQPILFNENYLSDSIEHSNQIKIIYPRICKRRGILFQISWLLFLTWRELL